MALLQWPNYDFGKGPDLGDDHGQGHDLSCCATSAHCYSVPRISAPVTILTILTILHYSTSDYSTAAGSQMMLSAARVADCSDGSGIANAGRRLHEGLGPHCNRLSELLFLNLLSSSA